MSRLYSQLRHASQSERYAIAEQLIKNMCDGDVTYTSANSDYADLCEDVLRTLGVERRNPPHRMRRGEFSPHDSADLLHGIPRLRGFLRAIHRTKGIRTAIDAGCGASAILAVAIAVAHPKSEIHAYELNLEAHQCAQTITMLLGLAGRITVCHADVTKVELPAVDLAVTETFSSGLLNELGHTITPILATRAEEILPRYSVISASDQYTGSSDAPWVEAARIDLAEHNDWVTGHLKSTDDGKRTIGAYASYYAVSGASILDVPGVDYLTMPIHLGDVDVPNKGDRIGFRYALGEPFHQSAALRWVEETAS